jgi:hypothetical protein
VRKALGEGLIRARTRLRLRTRADDGAGALGRRRMPSQLVGLNGEAVPPPELALPKLILTAKEEAQKQLADAKATKEAHVLALKDGVEADASDVAALREWSAAIERDEAHVHAAQQVLVR